MSDEGDAISDAIVTLVPALLNALDALGFAARHMHPPRLPELVAAVGPRARPLREGLDKFRAIAWPEELRQFREQIELASDLALRAFDGLGAAANAADGTLQAYRALRHVSRALEALYPVAAVLPRVSRFFLPTEQRDDAALVALIAGADRTREDIGVLHADNEPGMRGGFSLYVPEYYDPAKAYAVVVALHGGSGNGRAFLWSWLSEARGRGVILVSPTAVGDTWSLMEPELDTENIGRILAAVRQGWNVDPTHILLTGMSDGGTFSLVSGLGDGSPFTHLAPIAASFHPLLLDMAGPSRIAGLPIYLVHGALDWMFPVAMARAAERALAAAGAKVTYREIADLSHTYPRDENPRILDWFLGRSNT
jgi:phospholipase/carboxylesterase